MPEYHIRKYFKKRLRRFSAVSDLAETTPERWRWFSPAPTKSGRPISSLRDKNGTIDPKKVRVIWKTPGYPDYNWSIRGDVDNKRGRFHQRFKSALLSMKDPDLLSSFPREVIPADNSDYAPIKDTAKELGLIDWMPLLELRDESAAMTVGRSFAKFYL